MPTRMEGLELSLLGVGVSLACDDAELLDRLAVCYGRSLREGADGGRGRLAARLERDGEDAWRVRVDGREDRRLTDPVEAVRALNHELMHGVMLRSPELFFVHAAVVEHGRRGILLPGLSRAGKSTLAVAFLAAGARLLSDELLAWDPARGVALPFPRAPKVRDECAPYFPGFAAHFVGRGEGRFLPFDALPEDVVSERAPIDAVVLPRWAGPGLEPELEPVSAGAALLELATSALNFGTHRSRSLDLLGELVGRARAWRLAWSEPHAAVARVLEALEEGAT